MSPRALSGTWKVICSVMQVSTPWLLLSISCISHCWALTQGSTHNMGVTSQYSFPPTILCSCSPDPTAHFLQLCPRWEPMARWQRNKACFSTKLWNHGNSGYGESLRSFALGTLTVTYSLALQAKWVEQERTE